MSSITNNPPGQRELVYCHPCQDEWYRDEHGLVCPTCGGDFVEIIENNHDPRIPARGLGSGLPEDFDVDDDDGSDPQPPATFFRFEGPNFSFTSTQRTFGPRTQQQIRGGLARAESSESGGHETPDDVIMQLFTNMLRNIVGDQGMPGERDGPGGTPGSGHQSPRAQGGEEGPGGAHTHTPPIPPFFGGGPAVFSGGGRVHFDSSTRLNPRDADSPQPHDENVVDLHSFLASLIGPAGSDGGIFARVLGIPPGAGGDYVYSQADLDRVISQLMEQHQGNAPPPASKDAIDSLPKIKVTEQMVRDGVDCAVCKEDLVVEEEVAKLPCSHMYHFECVKRWLEAHDTCPICRHPVTPENQRPQPQSPGSRPHTTPWPFPMPRPQSSGPPPAPDHGSGNASGNASGSSGSRSGGWAALFRRGGSGH